MIHNLRVFYSDLIDPGSVCINADVSVALPTGVTVVCYNEGSVDIQIDDSIAGPYCLQFIVRCSAVCDVCDDLIIDRCFCVNPDDCTNCGTCVNNVCVSRCDPGKICDNDTCVDCVLDAQCLCNQLCNQGKCECPPDKPIKRSDGCCVQCIEGVTTLQPCQVCVAGMIVAKTCPDGHCNPITGDCNECLNDSHCTRPNECCKGNGICDCCLGYIRNPLTNECEPAPPCVSEADCMARYGPCSTCSPLGCIPKTCPLGQVAVVVAGVCKCVQACSPNNPCPPGQGCVNGGCIPCNQLDCTGTSGVQCAQAIGCKCEGTNCVGIDCNPANVSLGWIQSPGTPGQVQPGTGLPALQGTASIQALGIIYLQPPSGAGYQNHRFTVGVSNGASGTWTLKNTPTSSTPLGSGTSVTFELSQTGPNMVMFMVEFLESGSGRTAQWVFYRDITAPLIAPNVWSYEFNSSGVPPTVTGGSPGQLKLCANNANFQAVTVTNVTTTNSLVVSFFPDPANKSCLIAHVQGCGIWNGDMVLNCGGQTFTVPAPELSIDLAACCDPADVTCTGWGTGDPCVGVTIQPIDLVILPTYGANGAGDGEFMAVADWASAGLTALQMFYMNPAAGCWSAAPNPAASVNDLAVVTTPGQSPFGPSVSALSALFTFGDGGCIRFGHSCDLRIPGCKKIQGEECFTECTLFSVDIVEVGPNTYSAVPSMNDEVITYVWSYPGLVNNTTQTVTITPNGGNSTLMVTASYGPAPSKCTATDVLYLSTTIPGCTDTRACNYNAAANVNDGSCVIVPEGSYDCLLGFQPGVISYASLTAPSMVYKIGSTPLAQNDKLAQGTYTVDVYIDRVKYCSRTLVVPQCYLCNLAGNCVPAQANNNQGLYTTSNCDGVSCTCNIEIDIAQRSCANGQAAMYITATGDTGTYHVVVDRVGTGAQVLPDTMFTSGGMGVTTNSLCPGIYRVTVTGENCTASRDFQVVCDTCTGSTLDITNITHDCALSQLSFTIVGAPCSTNYNVQLLSQTQQPLTPPVSQNYTSTGVKNMIVGVRTAGHYLVRLTDNNGCVITKPITICPDDLPACDIGSADLYGTLSGLYATFTATVALTSNDGTYKVSLYELGAGSCAGTEIPTGPEVAFQFISGSGTHVVNFSNAVLFPGVTTCYVAKVEKTTDNSCVEYAYYTLVPSAVPQPCSGSVTNVSYDTLTGKVVVSWDFSNTSDSLTVQIQTGAGPACNPGDPVAVTSTGNGEDGTNIQFGPIPQTQSSQFICVTIWDEANPTCSASMTAVIPACSCGVEVLSYEVHPDVPEVEVTYRAKCTSGLVDLDFQGPGAADGTLVNQAATENGLWVEYTKVVTLGDYPAAGGSGSIQVIDQANGACQDSMTVALPANCVSCAQVATTYLNDSVVTTVKNHAGVIVLAGAYQLPTDGGALETDLYAELIDDGANFCIGPEPVDVMASRFSGILVNQDNTTYQSLDHAIITHGDFVGGKKVYFADCGCGITRLCDYEAQLPISPTADRIVLTFAANNPGGDYTGVVEIDIDVPQTFSGSDLAAMEAAILAALTGTSCASAVDAVTCTYDSGTDILTIQILQTNAGLGLVFTFQASSVGDVVDFTQSNCA